MRHNKGAKRAPTKPVLSARNASTLSLIDNRLLRCCDLMSCLELCQDSELNLGSLAIAARDLLDRTRDDLAILRRNFHKTVRS